MERDWRILAERVKAVKALKNYFGETLRLTISTSTGQEEEDVILNWVKPFDFILVDEKRILDLLQKMGEKIPHRAGRRSGTIIYFISGSYAIQRITSLASGEVLFYNPYVFVPYQISEAVTDIQPNVIDPGLSLFLETPTDDEIDSLVAISFGWKVAQKLRKERKRTKMSMRRKIKKDNDIAFRKGIALIEEGEKYVKEELKEKWWRVCTRLIYTGSFRGFYGFDIVYCAVKIMERLSQREQPEVAEEILQKGGLAHLTIGQAADVINVVSRFHPRGDEIREWWEKR